MYRRPSRRGRPTALCSAVDHG